MKKEKALITAYLLDGKGGGRQLKWSEINEWKPEQGVLWVHLNYSVPKTKSWLKQQPHIDALTVHAMTQTETRPRSIINHENILVFLRGVNLNPGENPEDMVSIRVLLTQNQIITSRSERLLSVDDIRQRIEKNTGPTTPQEFLIMLNDRLIDRMADVIDEIDENADKLEEEIIAKESHLLRPRISEVRRQSILIRRYLAPQREALNRLYVERHSLLSETDRLFIREASDRVFRYIEDLDSIRERASITQEELSSRLSEQLDSRMYILSVVAVIFIPLSFITGLLGINVGGIPGANFKWGFLLVCSILAVLLTAMLIYFRRKHWI